MESANATSYLISSIIVSVHVSVEHCLPLMQPIIAAVLTLRAGWLLSKSRFVQGSSSPVSLGKIHCREMKAPNWLRISPFIEILIRLLIHHLNSQYLCLVKRSFDTKISFITEDSSSELSWNQILTLILTLPISGIQPQFLPLFLLLIPTAVIPWLHFKSGQSFLLA